MDDLRPGLRNVSAPLEPLPASSLRGLDVSVPRAGEVVAPARPAALAQAERAGTNWYWIAVAAAAGAALLLLARRRHRRRRPLRVAS